jgi:hypothetical protein
VVEQAREFRPDVVVVPTTARAARWPRPSGPTVDGVEVVADLADAGGRPPTSW